MNENKLFDLIYDKLANNDEHEMFEPEMTEDMCVVSDWQEEGAPKIAIVIGGVEYVLSVKANKKGDYEIF